MNTIKITVVAPTYNRYKDLENLIKSFLLQDYLNSELLIIDDLGTPKTEAVVKKWMKKSNKILYHKNEKNIGVVENIRSSFYISSGDVIVFMGDDDIFIDNAALSLFANAFKDNGVGSAKASQILFKKGKVSQAFPLKRDKDEIIYYSGNEIFENIWFESISFTGLAFRNSSKIKKLITDSKTLFPQVELVGFIALQYKFAEINRHLVGVQSYSSSQLNPIFYNIAGIRTNILDDWLGIYKRISMIADKNKLRFISKKRFIDMLSSFVLIFLPYNSITNGKTESINFIFKTLKYNKRLLLNLVFWQSIIISIFFPEILIPNLLELIKKVRIKKQLNFEEIKKYNLLLSKYY